jgi:hypothetical protein
MPNEKFLEQLRRNAERFEEIKHLMDRVTWIGASYARQRYTVKLDEATSKLSDHDLIVLCDDGNACFGGEVGTRSGGSAPVAVYTD